MSECFVSEQVLSHPVLSGPASRHPLVDALVAAGLMSAESVERVQSVVSQSGLSPASVITRLGLVTEQEMASTFAGLLGLEIVRQLAFPRVFPSIAGLNAAYLKNKLVLPLAMDENAVELAMVDPADDEVVNGIGFLTQRSVVRRIVYQSDLEAFFQQQAHLAEEQAQVAPLNEHGANRAMEEDLTRLADHASDAPVIRLVNRLILGASDRQASDIHLEPTANGMSVRYRVDGLLQEMETLSMRWVEPVASRVKLMAHLDIAEKRLPQDGRIRFPVRGRNIDLRVATFPTHFGESIVLRLLGQQTVSLDLERVGLSDQGLGAMQAVLGQPHGIVLITGPTGSGKTTTLYAALNAVRNPELKIITVEDPIEYTLAGVSQLQVKPDIGLSYPAALRSILRNDPDVIMIGEIRDRETADIAIRAALTGHLVLSTLHTNTAAGAVTRLLDLGIEDFLLASTLRLTAAQRLVRRLCPHCKVDRSPSPDERALFTTLRSQQAVPEVVFEPRGCDHCGGRGYLGRTPVFEAIPIGEDERAIIRHWQDEAHLSKTFVDAGGMDLWGHGLQKVASGETSLADVLRVVERPKA